MVAIRRLRYAPTHGGGEDDDERVHQCLKDAKHQKVVTGILPSERCYVCVLKGESPVNGPHSETLRHPCATERTPLPLLELTTATVRIPAGVTLQRDRNRD